MLSFKWMTIVRDNDLSGDGPFMQDPQKTKPIEDFKTDLQHLKTSIQADEIPLDLKTEGSREINALVHHLDNLRHNPSFPFRLPALLPLLPVFVGTLYVALQLVEWGQFIAQLAMLSRSLSIAVALWRFTRTTPTLIISFHEDRIVGEVPSLIMFAAACPATTQHLHRDWRYTLAVGVLTAAVLFGVSFWRVVWQSHRLRKLKSLAAPHTLSGEPKQNLIAARDAFARSLKALQSHTQEANISDPMKSHFLLIKRDGDCLLGKINLYLPAKDIQPPPKYPRSPKTPVPILAAIVQGVILWSSWPYPWLLSVQFSWALWIMARLIYGWWSPFYSKGDLARMASRIASGTYALLPMFLIILFTNGRVLEANLGKSLLAIGSWLMVNVFSDLITVGSEWLINLCIFVCEWIATRSVKIVGFLR